MPKRNRIGLYRPTLTPRQLEDLEREITEFDEAKTLKEIEQSSEYRWDKELSEFNDPDLIDADKMVKLGKPPLDKQVEMAKIEIDEILPHRQKQVWRLCMRDGLSQEQAAVQLHMTRTALETHLQRAIKKVERHFNEQTKQ